MGNNFENEHLSPDPEKIPASEKSKQEFALLVGSLVQGGRISSAKIELKEEWIAGSDYLRASIKLGPEEVKASTVAQKRFHSLFGKGWPKAKVVLGSLNPDGSDAEGEVRYHLYDDGRFETVGAHDRNIEDESKTFLDSIGMLGDGRAFAREAGAFDLTEAEAQEINGKLRAFLGNPDRKRVGS